MLVSQTKEKIKILLLRVHQHGRHDSVQYNKRDKKDKNRNANKIQLLRSIKYCLGRGLELLSALLLRPRQCATIQALFLF